MKKFYKIMAGSALSLMMTLSSVNGVSAATHLGYSATVNSKSGEFQIMETTPNASYTWVLNYLPTKDGEIRSIYKAKYSSGSFNVSGPEITLPGNTSKISAIWTPSGVSGKPAVFGADGIYNGATCVGQGVTTSYCAKTGTKYRLYLKNTTSKTVNVSGQFTFTER